MLDPVLQEDKAPRDDGPESRAPDESAKRQLHLCIHALSLPRRPAPSCDEW